MKNTLVDKLRENGFQPIPHTARAKKDMEHVRSQKLIVAKSISQALDSIPYLTDKEIICATLDNYRDILTPEKDEFLPQAWKRARRYFPEMTGGRKTLFTHPSAPYVFSKNAWLTDCPEVKLANPNWAIQEALEIPERLAKIINLNLTWCQNLNLFVYKNKNIFYEELRKRYAKIHEKYGGFKDLRSI